MKKKILIISTIILVIVIGLIGLFVFYKVQQKEKTVEVSKINDTEITEEKIVEETKDENASNNELVQNTNEEIKEKTEEKQESQESQETKEQKETNEKNNQETKEKVNTETQKIKENNNSNKNNSNNQQTTNQVTNSKIETPKQEEKQPEITKTEPVKIDLSKYDRYENALNGGYKAYKKSDSEMNKLRELIESCIKEYGYTNVKIVQSSSIINNTQSFTANKTNVSNKVYDSEDFTIYYYAETEYHITSNGTESIFQNRSYIKVK